jgi:hypothetical protein
MQAMAIFVGLQVQRGSADAARHVSEDAELAV